MSGTKMKQYYLGADNMPCIWPVPDDCVWHSERYQLGSILKIAAPEKLVGEAAIFIGQLRDACNLDATLVDNGADVSVRWLDDADMDSQGYTLEADRTGVRITTASGSGAFYGFQTLLQLIANSPDPSIHGVRIIDRPIEVVRSVRLSIAGMDVALFRRFVSLLCKYKINCLVINTKEFDETFSANERNELAGFMKSRYLKLETGSTGESDCCLNALYEALETSCCLWWKGFAPFKTEFGEAMPEYLGRIAAQLFPMERDQLLGIAPPSSCSRNYKALALRAFYNSPLYRLSWRPDDYDFSFLADAKNLANTVPISLFQGVMDTRLQSALILAGNGRNNGVFGIPVGIELRSLVFLHSYIIDRKELNGVCVGQYQMIYRDGSIVLAEIKIGSTICCKATGHGGNARAVNADPVFTGITRFGMPYTVCSCEWINPWPDKAVEKIDILPAEGMDAGGIALFGITAIL